jgi:hypothetical protein
MPRSPLIEVSVLLSAHNEEANIEQAVAELGSVAEVPIRTARVIVVDRRLDRTGRPNSSAPPAEKVARVPRRWVTLPSPDAIHVD